MSTQRVFFAQFAIAHPGRGVVISGPVLTLTQPRSRARQWCTSVPDTGRGKKRYFCSLSSREPRQGIVISGMAGDF